MENKPNHIAIILDGNRSWAKTKGMPATDGHKYGAKVLEDISKYANKIGIKYLTVYAFSTENWKRSKEEVSLLMSLFESYLENYSKEALKENIKVNIIGSREGLSKKLTQNISKCEEMTKDCTGLNMNIALNYGSREELTNAVKTIARDVKDGKIELEEISEETITKALYTAHASDPDLVIRTSGQKRLSNFMLWQLAYAEFLFIDKYWPDFTTEDLDEAVAEYVKRNRKYGV